MEGEILEFFKVFSDVQRIRMAALLSEQALTVEQIADRLKMRPVEVPRQLNQFEKLNLLVQEGPNYRLDSKALEKLSRDNLSHLRGQPVENSNDENADEFDRKVVRNYSLPDGRLKELPIQGRKMMAILRHVVEVFEPGGRYTEKEVNVALAKFHADTATLRRALIDNQMLERDTHGAAYWRK